MPREDKYARYNRSPKGKARVARYRATVKGVIARFKAGTNLTTKRRGQ
jgi:hypothetical protein